MDVFVSTNIVSLLSIEQDDDIVIVEREIGYLHVKEIKGKLNIYVPKSKKRRRACLAQHLPIALLKHFGVLNLTNGTNPCNILAAGSLFEVDWLPECTGIIEIQGIERPDVEEVGR